MLIVFYLLVVEQVLQGLHNLWDGTRWLRMVQRRLASHPGFYTPRVAVICPVKGLEPGLEQNLTALTCFDYPDYDIFFTMASANDPAAVVLKSVMQASKRRSHVIVAGPPADCGEKVNNLRVAVQQIPDNFDVFVFTDSDGRPGRTWLKQLVAPLADQTLGAVSTFRWYFRSRPGFFSALASAWNAPAVTYLGDQQHNFCWGGGTAIRRERFEQAGVVEYWRGSVSDDFSMTHALRAGGHRILFAPECLTPAMVDCDAATLLQFTNRQIIIARVYEPRLWALGGLGHLCYCVTILTGLALYFYNFVTGAPAIHILLLTLAPPMFCMGRGILRLTAVMELLPDWKAKLLADGWIWTLLAGVSPFLALWNSVVALSTRTIQWRGIRYELKSPNETRIASGRS